LACQAAEAEGIPLADPHAELGTTRRLRELADSIGLQIDDIQQAQWEDPEPLDDPSEYWQRIVNYGLGETLRTADPAARDRARCRFLEQAQGHHPTHDQFLARFALPAEGHFGYR